MQFFLVQWFSEVKRASMCRYTSLFYNWVVPSYVWGPFWSVLSNPLPSSAWEPSLTLLLPSTYFQPPLFLTEAQDVGVGSRIPPALNQCSRASMSEVLGKIVPIGCLHIFCVSNCKPRKDLDYINRDLLPFSCSDRDLSWHIWGIRSLSWACQWDLSSDWLCQ